MDDRVKDRIKCCDCGVTFDLTFGEVEWYLSKGLNIPQTLQAMPSGIEAQAQPRHGAAGGGEAE